MPLESRSRVVWNGTSAYVTAATSIKYLGQVLVSHLKPFVKFPAGLTKVHSTCIELWQVDLTVALILILTPASSLFLHFQKDKLIFGCVDANFGPKVKSTYQ